MVEMWVVRWEKAGYSEQTAKTPQKLTESKGFKELYDELGLTDELIISSLVHDIRRKPEGRKAELELAAKIKGLLQNKVEVKASEDVFYRAHMELQEAERAAGMW